MKLLLLVIVNLAAVTTCLSQETPVTWTAKAIKVEKDVFKVEIIADIADGWHTYSQTQPREAIALPTSFSYGYSSNIRKQGKTMERGDMRYFSDATVGIAANQYEGRVIFIQRFKIITKAASTTASVSIKVRFQACTNEKCLPPNSTDLTVQLTN